MIKMKMKRGGRREGEGFLPQRLRACLLKLRRPRGAEGGSGKVKSGKWRGLAHADTNLV